MRLIFKTLIAVFFGASAAFAGNGYGSCYVRNGTAHAMFCSKTSDSGSGTGSIIAFDQNGNLVFEDNIIIWVGIAVMGCEEAATVSVPSDAVGCSFSLEN